MKAPILTNVQNEGTTILARIVAFVSLGVSLLMQFGILTAGQGEAVLGFISNPTVAMVISAISALLTALLPAIQGWRSKDRELPSGMTTRDVQVKHTSTVSPTVAQKLGMVIFACVLTLGIGGCSTRASCPSRAVAGPPVVYQEPPTYLNTNAYPGAKMEQMRQQQGL